MINNNVIYGFCLIIIGCLIKLILTGDTNDKTFQKIIGGFSVFIVAILSNNPYVYSLSIFIGGLIIASENFMILLAAVLRSDGGTVPESINAINNLITNSSQKDIEEKKRETIKEIKEVDNIADELSLEIEEGGLLAQENIDIPEDKYVSILPKIEEAAINKLERSLQKKIERQVAFATKNGSLNVDGAIINNEKRILKLFEVKVYPKLPKNKKGKVMTYAIVENLKNTIYNLLPQLELISADSAAFHWQNTLTLAIVFNTKTDVAKIRKRIEEVRDEIEENHNYSFKIKFVFYNLENMDLDLDEM